MAIDPICGMTVDPQKARSAERNGEIFYFCCEHCRQTFLNPKPSSGLVQLSMGPRSSTKDTSQTASKGYYCPMCEGVSSPRPASCPICGMALIPVEGSGADEEDGELSSLLLRFVIAGPLALIVVVIAMLPMVGLDFGLVDSGWLGPWLQFTLTTVVVTYGGWPFLERGWQSLVVRRFNMFTLIAMGTLAGYGYSLIALLFPSWLPSSFAHHGAPPLYFESSAVIIVLVLLGQILELTARKKTGAAIRDLMALAPTHAWVVRHGEEIELAIDEIQIHDVVRLRPGQRVPVDGAIMEGTCTVDESMLSGESLPVEKGPDDLVFAGTIINSGSSLMVAQKVGHETTLGRMVELVTEAQRSRAPIQKFADRVSSYFVPVVFVCAVATFLFWAIVQPIQPALAYALMNSIAVLIIACPCALGLATPMSVVVGIGRGSKEGILIRNAETLERLRSIDTIAIDKTGTLTEGSPRWISCTLLGSWKEADVLQWTASLEHLSEHPLARAIQAEADARGLPLLGVHDFKSTAGYGVKGIVDGKSIEVNNRSTRADSTIDSLAPLVPVPEDGNTRVYVWVEEQLAARLSFADPIKGTTFKAIQSLKELGLAIVMLTGDRRETAERIAKECGIDTFLAGLKPADKLEWIQASRKAGHRVAMAGDGVNDAAALAAADVGIAMGAGTDIAKSASDVTLVHGDLRAIAKVLKLGRRTMANVYENMFLAMIYNGLAIPIAAGILYPVSPHLLLNPMIAAAAMSLSSVSVIGNALRLRGLQLDR